MSAPDASPIVYRWDLDKTYLRTEFDTVADLLRTAFEPPTVKRTVPGAAMLLRELRQTGPAGVYILSGSPQQMRRALEAKLRLDGIEWDGFTLKPSIENLLRGRFRYLKDQVSYKLGALFTSRLEVAPDTDEILFGDDAEADAFIYSLYADVLAGKVETPMLLDVFTEARTYVEDVPALIQKAGQLPRRETVRRIFIHLDRMRSPETFSELGRRVCPFYNYFQPALVLVEDGALPAEAALRVGAEIVFEQGFHPNALMASFMDVVQRRYVGPRTADRLAEAIVREPALSDSPAGSTLRHFVEEVGRRRGQIPPPLPVADRDIDYAALLPRDRMNAHAAKLRALWRRGS